MRTIDEIPVCRVSLKVYERITYSTLNMSGIRATFKFHDEVVHSFMSFPSVSEASNEYTARPGEEQLKHSFSGKMDEGKLMPELNSTGPYAALVTAIKRAKEDSEGFLKDRVEGPLPAKLNTQ